MVDLKDKKTELIEAYADACVEDMDLKTMMVALKDTIETDMSYESDDYIVSTIRDFYPHLLEGTEWE